MLKRKAGISKMYYGFDICPKCKNKLVIRRECKEHINDFDKYGGDICNRCGNKLVLAFAGDKKKDNTVYQIVLEGMLDQSKEKQCIEVIMKMLNCDFDSAKKAVYTRGKVCSTGNFIHTYLNMEALDSAEILYSVIPEFPFQRFIYPQICLCPDCGKETSERTEETGDWLKKGIYCKHCMEWIMYRMFNRKDLDRTIYRLEIFWEDTDIEIREKIEININDLTKEARSGDRLIIRGKASELFEVLQRLEKESIGYQINPPFPYEIPEFREIDKKFLNEILELSNKWQEF